MVQQPFLYFHETRKDDLIMKQINLGGTGPAVSEIALGCMRLSNLDEKQAEALLRTALELGVNFFDHADIYGKGESEKRFASALGMSPSLRGQMVIQTKCAIHDGMYDFSKAHILQSVDGSLKRLQTDYIDILLLHRPDTLMEPDEVAEAFSALRRSGKVRYFGVSNHNAAQMALLQSALGEKLLVNQLQFSLAHTGIIDAGFNVNLQNEAGIVRDGGILEACRLSGVTIQAWSPLQYGFFGGVFLDSPAYPELNRVLDGIAQAKQAAKSAVAISWILRHPARIQPILGTTSIAHLKEMCRASDLLLTREEWYALYRAAGNRLP